MSNSTNSTIIPPRELSAVECIDYLNATAFEIAKLTANSLTKKEIERVAKLNSNQLATLRYTQRAMARLLGQVRIALR